jgi:hypothetical protein
MAPILTFNREIESGALTEFAVQSSEVYWLMHKMRDCKVFM